LRKIQSQDIVDNNLRVIGKGKRKRTIQLEPVAMKWLLQVHLSPGPILGGHPSKLDEHFKTAMTKIGLRPDLVDDDTSDQNPSKNILRHTVCTYLHLIHGAAKAARMAGHSERIQESHYLGLRTEVEAKSWASLFPEKV
jgi:site-specific recombinase XerD